MAKTRQTKQSLLDDLEVMRMRVRELERERDNLHWEFERLRVITDGTDDGLWDWIDPRSGRIWWSPRAYELLGFKPDEFVVTIDVFAELLHPDDRAVHEPRLEQHLRQREPFDIECRLRHRDGDYRWFWICGRAYQDEAGEPTRMAGTMRDITEQKRDQETITRQAERFNLLARATQDAIFDADLQSQTIWRNETYCRKYGAPSEARWSDTWWEDRVHPEDRARALAIDDDLLAGRKNEAQYEYRLRRPDGDYAHILTRICVSHDADGQPSRFVGSLVDMTKYKQAESALKESEALHRTVLSNISDTVLLADDQGQLTFVCPNVHLQLGYSQSEVKQMQYVDRLLGPNLYDPQQLRQCGEIANIERTTLDKQGTPHTLLITVKQVGIANGSVLITCRDITERVNTERALRQSERRHREVVNNMATCVAVYQAVNNGENFVFLDINPAGARAGKRTREQHIGRSLQDVYPGVRQSGLFDLLQRVWRSGKPERCERLFYQDNLVEQYVENYVTRLPGGELMVVYEDITQRVLTERELRESEANLHALIENTGDIIASRDRDHRAVAYNSGFAHTVKKVFGVQAKPGICTPDLLPDEDRARWRAKLDFALSGKTFREEFAWDFGDEIRHYEISLHPIIVDGEVIGTTEFTRDITARKKAAQRLIDSEARLQSAQAIAHIGNWRFDKATEKSEWSDELYRIFGLERCRPQITPERVLAAVHADDRTMVQTAFMRALREGVPYTLDYRIIRPSGEVRHLRAIAEIERDESGKLTALFGTGQDVTEQKQAEQALREQSRFLHTLINVIPSAVFWKDTSGTYLGCNDTLCQWLGRTREELVGRGIREVYPEHLADIYFRADQELFANPGEQVYESQLTNTDGSHRDVLFQKATFTDADGNVAGLVGVGSDIGEIKRIQAELIESERDKSLILNTTTEVFVRYDTDLRILWANAAAGASIGKSPEYLIGKYCREFWQERSTPCENCPVMRAIATGQSQESEVTTPDGRTWYLRGHPVFDKDGNVVGAIEFSQDITQRRRAAEQISRNAEELRAVYDGTPVIMVLIDSNRRVRKANRAARGFRRHEDDLIGRYTGDVLRCIHALDDPRGCGFGPECGNCLIRQLVKDSLENQTEHHRIEATVHIQRNGEVTYPHLLVSCTPLALPDGPHVLLTLEDISVRKQTELELWESRRQLATLMDNLPGMVYRCKHDPEWTLEFVSDGCLTLTGYRPEQLIDNAHLPYGDLIHPADRARVSEKVQAALDSTHHFEVDYRITTAQGEEKYVWEQGQGIVNEDGETVAIEGYIADITDNKRSEVALRASQAFLHKTGIIARIGGWEHNLQERTVMWTKSLYDVVETDMEPPIEFDKRYDFFPAEDRVRLKTAYDRAVETGEPFNLDLRCYSGKNRLFWARIIGQPVFQDGECVRMVGTFQDITARQELEERLRQSQKMEAVGQLAGGIAHDFNNILTAVLGNVELLRYGFAKRLDRDDSMWEAVDEIDKAANRAATLTRQLLAFGRKQLIRPTTIDLCGLLADMDTMLRRLIRENIDLRVDCPTDTWPIKADAGQVQQVIINLAVNARDAMPESGQLRLRTMNVTLSENEAGHVTDAAPGQYVRLQVSDTGSGIDEETLNHIFEPFYTTKEVGRGTGLGLATVHGILQQAGGYVTVESELDKGTTFNVHWPIAKDAELPQPTTKSSQQVVGGSETVLVCEDDDAVRHLTVRTLEQQGYTVISADDPTKAIKLFESHAGTIDGLITDVIMPNMNGRQLADALTDRRPELRVLYVTGYASGLVTSEHEDATQGGILQKPFSPQQLPHRVRALFDRRP